MFKFKARYLLILNYYSSSLGESKYSPINGRLSKFSISIFSINNSVVLYKIGFPGTSNSPALSINPLDSNVLIDDSDSTPLISDIFNFVTGCSRGRQTFYNRRWFYIL